MRQKKQNRKAQSGMEYLITYGWAVLIVGIVVLLLLSLKVLDVDWWSVKNEAYMLSSFGIPDFKASPYLSSPDDTTVLIFQFVNNRGTNITIWNITAEDVEIGNPGGGLYVWDCPEPTTCILMHSIYNASPTLPFNMTAGKRLIINGTIPIPGEVNTVFTAKLQFVYSSPRSSQNHSETGMIRGRIEPE
ncbi:MAG: hypothetical protein ABIG39_03155 [Candidatus Micrarchaeota archaeon]